MGRTFGDHHQVYISRVVELLCSKRFLQAGMDNKGDDRQRLQNALDKCRDVWIVDTQAEGLLWPKLWQIDGYSMAAKASIFHVVARKGFDIPLLTSLIELGLNFDVIDQFGQSPAHVCGAVEVAKILWTCRANLYLRDMNGLTPKEAASKKSSLVSLTSEERTRYRNVNLFWDKAGTEEYPIVAQLAFDKKWWAVKSICRRWLLAGPAEIHIAYRGRTAEGWARHHGEVKMAEELSYLTKTKFLGEQLPPPDLALFCDCCSKTRAEPC